MYNLDKIYIFEEVKDALQKELESFEKLEEQLKGKAAWDKKMDSFQDALVDFSIDWNMDFACFLVKTNQEYTEFLQILSGIRMITKGDKFHYPRIYPSPFPLFLFIRDFEEDEVLIREMSVPKILGEVGLLLKAIQSGGITLEEYFTHENSLTRSAAKYLKDLRSS